MSGLRFAVRGDPDLVRACSSAGGDAVRADVVFVLGDPPDGDATPAGVTPVVYWDARGERALRAQDRSIGDFAGAWRSLPLPVADDRFRRVLSEPIESAVWISPMGPRRREYLSMFTHSEASPSPVAVAINLREEAGPLFSHQALSALAAGYVLVSETVEPSLGLEPGIDYIDGHAFDEIFVAVEAVVASPGSFQRMRLSGQRKAERFRASEVFQRVGADLLAELA